jgi:MFS family permease
MDFANEIPGTYYPLYVLALGGSPATVGLIGFASSLALASVQFPGGYLADKYGRRWLVSSLTFGVALAHLFYAFAPTWQFILLGAILANIFLVYQPALLALLADALPSEKRGMGYSIIALITGVATTPGPIIAGLLFVSLGLVGGVRIGYLILVGMYLSAAVLRLKLRETVHEPSKVSLEELLGAYPRSLREGIGVWRNVDPAMKFLFFTGLLATFGNGLIMPFIVIYAVEDLGISEFQWSILLTTLFVAMIAVAYPSGKLIDKYGRKKPLTLSLLMMVPAGLLFLYGDFPRLLISLPLFGLTQIMSMSASQSLQADLVPREQRGKIIGSSNFVNNIMMAVGALTGGFVYQDISHQLPFWLLLGLILPQLFLVVFRVEEPEKRQE